jgi:hypothetical protein
VVKPEAALKMAEEFMQSNSHGRSETELAEILAETSNASKMQKRFF